MNYPLTFKAAILDKIGCPLKLENITFRGPLLKGQVLVKLYYSGICGKQIEEIEGKGGFDSFIPHLLGHEGTGKIIDIGPNVKKLTINDNVVLHWRKGSGIESQTPTYFLNKKKINAGWVTTFNEYAVVSENRLTKIPKKSDMKTAALYGCALTTGIGVIMNQAKIKSHHNVVIYGCGGVGLFAIQAAKILKPKSIIAIDKNDKSLSLALKLGATKIINSKKVNPLKIIKNLTCGRGAERVIVLTGNKMAINSAINLVSTPGEYIQVGVPEKGDKIEIDGWDLMHNKNYSGSMCGETYPDRDIPLYYKLEKKGLIKTSKIISKVFNLEDINKAILNFKKNKTGRIMIKLH